MTGFLLQLGAPLQSWGEHSAFTDRDTVAHPTRSGLIGMIASAMGIPRDQAIADPAVNNRFAALTHLRFTVRIDRPGQRLRDYHTIGGGYPRHRTVPTAAGTRRNVDKATVVSQRHYLSDAVFTVAVTAHAGSPLLDDCAAALTAPRWPLHLGRRSCPPGALFLLGTAVEDPIAELFNRVPLARPRPADARPEATVPVRFTSDSPFDTTAHGTPSARGTVTTFHDDPVRLTPTDRLYHPRHAYTTSRNLPAGLCGGYGTDYLDALDTYLNSPREEATS